MHFWESTQIIQRKLERYEISIFPEQEYIIFFMKLDENVHLIDLMSYFFPTTQAKKFPFHSLVFKSTI